jgi:2-succinyl-5-enolpyruvyl-6-hydroxy-3-cyclohexene-1-carboxylate synthase
MNSLSKTEQKEQEAHGAALEAAKGKLEDAISAFNAEMLSLFENVQAATEEYNEVVDQANGWRDDIHNAQEAFFDEKSERWQEGDRGENYSSWAEEWDNALEQVEVDCPDEIPMPEMDQVETITNLPAAPQ